MLAWRARLLLPYRPLLSGKEPSNKTAGKARRHHKFTTASHRCPTAGWGCIRPDLTLTVPDLACWEQKSASIPSRVPNNAPSPAWWKPFMALFLTSSARNEF